MTFAELISKALHGADEATVDYVLWNRTPFPFDPSPRILFKRASGYRRACANGLTLCDFCHRQAVPNDWTCEPCKTALSDHQ